LNWISELELQLTVSISRGAKRRRLHGVVYARHGRELMG
jgi:hypothetical protein